jgi:hypothetical protein
MRLKEWRYLRFGPAVVYDVPDANTASVHFWVDALTDPVHEGLVPVALHELREDLRDRGARMWVVQTPLFDGNYRTIDYVPRADAVGRAATDRFERSWRRAHRRWWEFWKRDAWLPVRR